MLVVSLQKKVDSDSDRAVRGEEGLSASNEESKQRKGMGEERKRIRRFYFKRKTF